MVRTVENWIAILKVQKEPVNKAAALLGDLVHYKHGGSYEDVDRQQIINFMEAVRQTIEDQVQIEMRTLG